MISVDNYAQCIVGLITEGFEMSSENLILLGIALLNAITAFLAYRTHQNAITTNVNMATLEKNTNSIKDALVASARIQGHGEGVAKERLDEQARKDKEQTK